MRNKKLKTFMFVSFVLLLSVNLIAQSQMARAHSPKFIDLKFYLDDQVLSIYYVHGVSDTTFHYINNTEIEFYNLSEAFLPYIDGLISNGTIDGRDKIVEAHIKEEFLEDRVAFNVTYTEQHDDSIDTQDTLIVHDNITVNDPLDGGIAGLNITYWTFIRVTAHCNQGGNFTQTALAGQVWYDIEHSMIEAVVPTLVCAVIILTPLVVWAIIGKRREKRKITQEVSQ